MVLSFYHAVDDAVTVPVVFINVKINDITDVDKFLMSFEIPAGFAHDDIAAVIDKVETSYTLDNDPCHKQSAARLFLFFLVAFFRLFRLRFRSRAYLKVDGSALIKLRIGLILLIDDITLANG